MLNRAVNEGFSGGEKKRNEIFQMAVLEPKLADARRDRSGPRHRRAARSSPTASTRSAAPTARSSSSRTISGCSNYIVPDFVHVLTDGRIVRSGGKELALELEAKGYGWVEAARRGARREPMSAGRRTARDADRRSSRRSGATPAFGADAPGAMRASARVRRDSSTRGFPTTRAEEWGTRASRRSPDAPFVRARRALSIGATLEPFLFGDAVPAQSSW